MGEQVFYTPSDLFEQILRKLLPTKIVIEGDKKIDVTEIFPLSIRYDTEYGKFIFFQ